MVVSHHYSGPDWVPPRGRPTDLTDLHAFPKAGDAGKSILIMNVHPAVGENAPGPTPSMGCGVQLSLAKTPAGPPAVARPSTPRSKS